jgi:hypothetical protein
MKNPPLLRRMAADNNNKTTAATAADTQTGHNHFDYADNNNDDDDNNNYNDEGSSSTAALLQLCCIDLYAHAGTLWAHWRGYRLTRSLDADVKDSLQKASDAFYQADSSATNAAAPAAATAEVQSGTV